MAMMEGVAVTQQVVEVRRLAGALGAEVLGVDLAAGVDDDVFAAIHAASLEHQVPCIRGQQELTPEGQLPSAAR